MKVEPQNAAPNADIQQLTLDFQKNVFDELQKANSAGVGVIDLIGALEWVKHSFVADFRDQQRIEAFKAAALEAQAKQAATQQYVAAGELPGGTVAGAAQTEGGAA